MLACLLYGSFADVLDAVPGLAKSPFAEDQLIAAVDELTSRGYEDEAAQLRERLEAAGVFRTEAERWWAAVAKVRMAEAKQQHRVALDALDEALPLAPTPAERTAALVRKAELALAACNFEEVVRTADALAKEATASTTQRARVTLAHARALLASGDYDNAVTVARTRVLRRDVVLSLEGVAVEISALIRRGDIDKGLRAFSRARSAARTDTARRRLSVLERELSLPELRLLRALFGKEAVERASPFEAEPPAA
jgi:tetratricopeptide (TPR) repeat protein